MVKRDRENCHHQGFKADTVGVHFPVYLFHINVPYVIQTEAKIRNLHPLLSLFDPFSSVFTNSMEVSPMCTAQMLPSILAFSPSLFHPKHPCDCSLIQSNPRLGLFCTVCLKSTVLRSCFQHSNAGSFTQSWCDLGDIAQHVCISASFTVK